MRREINAEVYDQNVLAEGLQVQIDNYYQPKTIAQKRRIELVVGLLDPQPDQKILDIGCGVGTFAYAAAKQQSQAYGLDYSHESLKVAKLLANRFKTGQNSVFVTASALSLPYKDNCFDKVVIADFIEHITDPEKKLLLEEVWRVLKPGGEGVVFTPNAIRENIGEIYWKLRHLVSKEKIPKTDLHYGLISRRKFERILKQNNFKFSFKYADTTRPYLARIPLFNYLLALNLLWKIKKV
ncbi:MAG: methyltransferase domain-containing protein [Candidatus Omnitrophica bacterium]|nr:methyltransferase domain-containing protein [Candidatus Omnitrophota bacterium]